VQESNPSSEEAPTSRVFDYRHGDGNGEDEFEEARVREGE